MTTTHFGITPTTGCTAILSGLSSLLMANGGAGAGGSGCVRTIKRYAEKGYELEAIDRLTTSGLPALLVACMGGPFKPFEVNNQNHEQLLKFAIVVAAGRYSSQSDRMAGAAPTVDPGAEDLLDWATYYGCRALHTAGFKKVRPTQHLWLRFEPEKYLAVTELEATRMLDIYSDDPATVLETLGIVHNPTSYTHLFEVDNTTPKTTAPATVRGGVTDL
jgi:hypothetical protein